MSYTQTVQLSSGEHVTVQAWPLSDIAANSSDFYALLELLAAQPDLYAAVPNGTDQTYLREFLLVADHNAYHLGELALLKRLLAAGPHEEQKA